MFVTSNTTILGADSVSSRLRYLHHHAAIEVGITRTAGGRANEAEEGKSDTSNARIFAAPQTPSLVSGPFGETVGLLDTEGPLPAFHIAVWTGIEPFRAAALAATTLRDVAGKSLRLARPEEYPVPKLDLLSTAQALTLSKDLDIAPFDPDSNIPGVFLGALTVRALPIGVTLITLPLTPFGRDLVARRADARLPFSEEFLTLRQTLDFGEGSRLVTTGSLPCLRVTDQVFDSGDESEAPQWARLLGLGKAFGLERCEP